MTPRRRRTSFDEALTLTAAQAAGDSPQELSNVLARCHRSIGLAALGSGRPTEALTSFQTALEMYRALAAADPTSPATLRELALTYDNLGSLEVQMGKPSEALASFENERVICREAGRDQPREVRFPG